MSQLEHIEAIEKRLWSAADNLRANSNYASNEYFLPVMGLVFLRHAYSRYLGACPRIENLLRKGPFGQISQSFSLNSHHYPPQMIEKSDSKRLSLATASILGQPPSGQGRNRT